MSEIVKAVVVSKAVAEGSKDLIKPVYEDLAQPAVKEIGTTLGRTVHALLSPIRSLCWGYEKIEKAVAKGLEKRLEKVEPEKLKTPEPEIAVPLMQALTYTAQNETLREMYLNLLANAMNSDYDKDVHPSYAYIINQMNSLDALVFSKLFVEYRSVKIKIVNPNVTDKEKQVDYASAMPVWFMGWTIEGYDIFDISTCFVRLWRLELIDIRHGIGLRDPIGEVVGYNELQSSALIKSQFEKWSIEHPWHNVELNFSLSHLYINEFGLRFAKACLPTPTDTVNEDA